MSGDAAEELANNLRKVVDKTSQVFEKFKLTVERNNLFYIYGCHR